MINIAFGIDNNWVQYCSATIASILSNHKQESPNDKIHFFIFGNITNLKQKKILQLKLIQDFDIDFIPVNAKIFNKIPLKGRSVSMLYRLLIPEVLPNKIEKIIYLDSDLVVISDIAHLWNISINDYLVAACLDYPRKGQKDGYFNSGVMIFNIKKLVDFGFNSKYKEFVKNLSKTEELKFLDQDILNAIIPAKQTLILDKKWNGTAFNFETILQENNNRSISEIMRLIHILHYTSDKPWLPYCENQLKDYYIKYAKMTAWKDKAGNFSFFEKASYFLKRFFKYWFIHPAFFIKPSFWKKVMKNGFISEIK
ncbi:MAG: glycosyltransferase family 8 protein [Endomicrobia bacterium]|nr:glycosyltransferase family 8 protein [Endomicrobiia bacterium]MCL2506088.1 glycosyltransferase family 8 protein [Endomicrobiia bacterium]